MLRKTRTVFTYGDSFLHDLDHDMALECAVASGSQCIVTRNVKYFRRVQELKMQAI